MTKNIIFRQGDVLIRRVAKLPNVVEAIERENGRVVLAHGELTGHAHAINDKGVRLLQDPSKARFIEVTDDTVSLVHEEHSTVSIPKGFYRVLRQTEYAPEALRNVAD